jgi:hypothetical protein
MDDTSVTARLDRIGALDRSGAAPGELLAELRGLLCEAEQEAVELSARDDEREVVERLGAAPHGT